MEGDRVDRVDRVDQLGRVGVPLQRGATTRAEAILLLYRFSALVTHHVPA